jgi:hypothetical protein
MKPFVKLIYENEKTICGINLIELCIVWPNKPSTYYRVENLIVAHDCLLS